MFNELEALGDGQGTALDRCCSPSQTPRPPRGFRLAELCHIGLRLYLGSLQLETHRLRLILGSGTLALRVGQLGCAVRTDCQATRSGGGLFAEHSRF